MRYFVVYASLRIVRLRVEDTNTQISTSVFIVPKIFYKLIFQYSQGLSWCMWGMVAIFRWHLLLGIATTNS